MPDEFDNELDQIMADTTAKAEPMPSGTPAAAALIQFIERVERLEEAIARIKQRLRATGEREVKSLVLGELVMSELSKLDEVAYIRFASVYRRFQDLNEFREEIERLAREPSKS